MGIVQADISAEDVINAMDEDGQFAYEMWLTLAERLHMGLLQDQLADLLQSAGAERATPIIRQFKDTFSLIEDLHFKEGDQT